MREAIEEEILFLFEQVRTLQRARGAIEKQILHLETRVQDLRKTLRNAEKERTTNEQ